MGPGPFGSSPARFPELPDNSLIQYTPRSFQVQVEGSQELGAERGFDVLRLALHSSSAMITDTPNVKLL